MDKSKLAQFQEISNSSDDVGCEFLKRCDNDLNYSIPDAPDKVYRYECEPGYSYLHIATKNFDLASVHELIKRKVDLVKQAHKDGQTPLHIASGHFSCYPLFSHGSVMDYVGKLKKNKFVEALLSAQVETDITANPKSADGTSHLHIACIYNHTEAIQLLLSAGESVNHATNDKHRLPGYTALHFAIRYSAFEAATILLNHGADMHLKDFQGKSALHLMMERLLDIADFLAIGKRSYHPFYEQEKDILESILKVFLKSSRVEDVLDDRGLTLLHVLCIFKESAVIKQFFKPNMDVNGATKSDSKLCPGWTPLHFAACFNVETFKFLLQNGADITAKNAKGNTPLDFCMERYTPNIVQSILSTKQELRNISFSDGSTKLLDILLIMANSDMFRNWLENLVNIDICIPLHSPIWPGCNLLHLAVLNERIHLKDAKMVFEKEIRFDYRPNIDKGIVDEWKFIMYSLLRKAYNFRSKNADGLTPFFLAFHQRRALSVDMILNSRKINEDSEGLSSFHLACATGKISVIEDLRVTMRGLNEPIKRDFEWYSDGPNSKLVRVSKSSTPLHIAIIFEQADVVQYLIEHEANIHCKDQRGLTPLHLALMKEKGGYSSPEITKIFLEKMIASNEFVTKDKLHCLHIAVICNDGKAIEKLLQNGVKTEILFKPSNPELRARFADEIGKTPLQIAVLRGHPKAEEALLKGGARDVSAAQKPEKPTADGYRVDDDCASKLKQKKRYFVKPINEAGLTTLHVACDKCDVAWAKSLLKKRADPNARLTLEKYGNDGVTPLHILASSGSSWIDVKSNVVEMAELLIEYGADVTIKNAKGKTPLLALYHESYGKITYRSSEKVPERFLPAIGMLSRAQKIYNVNPTNRYGLSHFHLACFTNNLDAVKGFLEASVDVDQTCDPFANTSRHLGYTPLHFALDQKHAGVARLLIERGANVNAEDVQGDTPLHTALKRGLIDERLIGLMLGHGLDINAKNTKGTTPVEYFVRTEAFTLPQLEFMLSHGAVIDLTHDKQTGDGVLGLALKNAKPSDRESILSRIMNACDIKSVIKKGCNVIDSAVNVHQEDQLTVDFYSNVIDQLIDAGCDINQKNRQGKTALYRAISLCNCEAVKALLLAGADVNVVDKNGESFLTKEVLDDRRFYNVNPRETLFFVVSQLWKMRNIGLQVNETTETAFLKLFQRYTSSEDRSNFGDIRQLCLDELHNKVEETFIGQLNLNTFLSDTEAVMWYSRMPLEERQLVDVFFKCGDNVRRGFPGWAGLLTMQYRKAVARAKIIRPAMRVIFSAGIKLPAICLEEIVEYLKYDELELLVKEH